MTGTGPYKDAFGRPVVAVTGTGVVTSLGVGKEDNWAALKDGRSGIRQIERFPTEGLRTTVAGTIDYLFPGRVPGPVLTDRFATLAAEEAVAEAGIGTKGRFPGPLFIAVPPVEVEWPDRIDLAEAVGPEGGNYYDELMRIPDLERQDVYEQYLVGWVAEQIAERFGTEGLPISISTACASGGTAIQLGVEAIRRGECEAALCIGTDGSVNPESLIRFSLLAALSSSNQPPRSASKPFSRNRDGFVMAEGAGALVLESLESAAARGAHVLGIVSGLGERADSFHRTRSNPNGVPIIDTIRDALRDAHLEPGQIDYINAHGTGTPENDKMECLALHAVFGEGAAGIPVSSNKSMIGHTLSAAGALEAVFSLLTLKHQWLLPTINYLEPDPALVLDVVPNTARPAKVGRVLSNSFGFGGQNVCLVLEQEPA